MRAVSTSRRWLRFGAAAALVGAGVLGSAASASAHSSLVRMEPADGAVVTTPPPVVRLVFNEAVQARFVVVVAVTTADGVRVDSGAPQVADTTVTQPLTPLPSAGRYTVSCRVVSADGHPLTLQRGFTYAPSSPPSLAAAPAGAQPATSSDPRSSPAPAAAVTPAGREGAQPGFVEKHWAHALWAALIVAAGVLVLWWERRRRA